MTLREFRTALPHPYKVKVVGMVDIEGKRTPFYKVEDTLYLTQFEPVLECEIISFQAPMANYFEICIK